VSACRPFQGLDAAKVIETADALQRRIAERFPDSGLSRLALELHEISRGTAATARALATPILWLRALVALCSALAVAAFVGSLWFLQGTTKVFSSVAEFFQGLDAFINELVFVGLALLFLFTVENRIKRARALKSLYLLRSLAHIVDMHQLTKDPERVAGTGRDTPSSPRRQLTPFELTRYLDYCSEMLALLSKLAALHAQHFDDPVTLVAVNDVENLSQGLARTIWQKIVVLDRVRGDAPGAG
jgi:hypothetical protein